MKLNSVSFYLNEKLAGLMSCLQNFLLNLHTFSTQDVETFEAPVLSKADIGRDKETLKKINGNLLHSEQDLKNHVQIQRL